MTTAGAGGQGEKRWACAWPRRERGKGAGVTRIAPLAVILMGVGLLGCGADDAPSKQEFANDAERICRETEKEIEKIGQSAGSPEEVAEAIDKVIDKSREAAEALVDLERPEGGDGDTAEQFVEGFESELDGKVVPALEDLRRALEEKDPKAVREAAERLQQLEASESDRFARELGANACVG